MHSRAIVTVIVWCVTLISKDTCLHCGWKSCLGSGIQFVRVVWMEWVLTLGHEKWVWVQGV